MKEYKVDAYLSIKDEEAFDRELSFKEGEDYKVTRVVDDGSNTGSGVYVIDGRGEEVFVDLMDLTVSESRDFGVLRTELFCVDKLVKGDKVLILQMSKMEEGEQFNVGEVAEVSLVGSDGTVYLESRYEEFVPVRNYERGYITKVYEIVEKKEGGVEDMLKFFEAGDIIKVLEPDRIVAGYDLTKGREYTVVNEYSEEGCYIFDDEWESLYLTKYEIEAHCEVIKKEEVNTKEKRGSMLKVNVIKDETKTVEDKWKAGNVLSNEDGSTVIMLVKPEYIRESIVALFLKHDGNPNREYSMDESSKSFWLEECPILVSKSELNIEI